MITVRPSVPEDADGVRQVTESATATLRETYRPNKKALENRKRLSSQLNRLVALLDGEIVGTTLYYLDGETVRVIGLSVRADCRRRGVARALVQGVADIGRKAGRRFIATRTVEETGNVPVFQKLGFVVSAERPDEYSESDKYRELTEVDLEMNIA